MRSILIGCAIGLVVSLAIGRFIEADAEHHIDEHVRIFESRWHAMQIAGCWR